MQAASILNDNRHFPMEKIEAFVKESVAIEHIPLKDKFKKDTGYFGAFILSQNQANEHTPLTEKSFSKWCKMTGNEIKGNHVEKAWLEKYNQGVKVLEDAPNIVAFVEFVSEIACQFQDMNNKAAHPGMLTRLLINYTATRVGYPFLIFHPDEEQKFIEGVKNPNAMRLFIADKVQEAVFGINGQWMDRVNQGSTSKYVCPGSTIRVQWNDLIAAQDKWKIK